MLRRLSSARAPLVTRRNKTASTAADDGERKQPANDQVPRGQSEQEEVERLAEDRVGSAAARAAHTRTAPAWATPPSSSCR